MKTKTIVFDIDGVLADFMGGFHRLSEEINGVVVPGTGTGWDNYGGLPAAYVQKTWQTIAKNPTFWLGLWPLFNTEEKQQIVDLVENHTVYFATARPTPHALKMSQQWLKSQLGLAVHISVVGTKRKGEFCRTVNADFMLDDKSENVDCACWLTDGKTKAFVISRPHNLYPFAPHSSKAGRVETVGQFIAEVLR